MLANSFVIANVKQTNCAKTHLRCYFLNEAAAIMRQVVRDSKGPNAQSCALPQFTVKHCTFYFTIYLTTIQFSVLFSLKFWIQKIKTNVFTCNSLNSV